MQLPKINNLGNRNWADKTKQESRNSITKPIFERQDGSKWWKNKRGFSYQLRDGQIGSITKNVR